MHRPAFHLALVGGFSAQLCVLKACSSHADNFTACCKFIARLNLVEPAVEPHAAFWPPSAARHVSLGAQHSAGLRLGVHR
jgi:hypothetical protein